MAKIKVPKTPPTAYNPKRRPNALILAHVEGLEQRLKEKGGRFKDSAHNRKTPRSRPTADAEPARQDADSTLTVALTMVPPASPRKRRKKSR